MLANPTSANVFGDKIEISDVGPCNAINTGNGDNTKIIVNCEWVDSELRGQLEAFLSRNLELTEDLRFKLNQLSIPYTPEAFLNALLTNDQKVATWFLQIGMPSDIEVADGQAITNLIYRNQSRQFTRDILPVLILFGLDRDAKYFFRGRNGKTLIEHAIYAGNLEAALVLSELGIHKSEIEAAITSFKSEHIPPFNRDNAAITKLEKHFGLLKPLHVRVIESRRTGPERSPTRWAALIDSLRGLDELTYQSKDGTWKLAHQFTPYRFEVPIEVLADYTTVTVSGTDHLGKTLPKRTIPINLINEAIQEDIDSLKAELKKGAFPSMRQGDRVFYDFSKLLRYGGAIKEIRIGIYDDNAATALAFAHPSNTQILKKQRVYSTLAPIHFELPILIDHMIIEIALASGEKIGCDYAVNYAFNMLTPRELSDPSRVIEGQQEPPCQSYIQRTGRDF